MPDSSGSRIHRKRLSDGSYARDAGVTPALLAEWHQMLADMRNGTLRPFGYASAAAGNQRSLQTENQRRSLAQSAGLRPAGSQGQTAPPAQQVSHL